jgi:two-component system, sensor histidine kinase and response regulator
MVCLSAAARGAGLDGNRREAERLRVLRSLELPAAASNALLDGLLRAAALALRCDTVAVSLVDDVRRWHIAVAGGPVADGPRDAAICTDVLLGDRLLEVPDVSAQPRYAAWSEHFRFYAGMPLHVDGHGVGALCAIHSRPHRLNSAQRQLLMDVAVAVEQWLLAHRQELAAQALSVEHERSVAWTRNITAAVEQAHEAVVITDPCGVVEYANEAALRRSGYQRAELVGQPVAMLRSMSTTDQVCQQMQARVLAGKHWRGVLQSRDKDGSSRLEMVHVMPLRDANGRISHALSISEDVTQKHRLRDELVRYRNRLDGLVAERTQALEQARAEAVASSQAKSEFLATISHEIRTPMNGVLGAADVLARSALEASQHKWVAVIQESAHTLMGLIDGVLDHSKIEAGHLSIEPQALALRPWLASAVDALSPLAASRGVELQWTADADLPMHIQADGLRLRQIVTNLLGNAIKFSSGREQPGQVRLAAQRESAGHWMLRVADNGIGLTAAAQAKLFQPFVQADSSTTRQYGGCGLGLAISQRLAAAMGGHIQVQSEPGQGACFTVCLPLVLSTAPAAQTKTEWIAPQAPADEAPMRVLVAEDNDISCLVIEQQLALLGCTVDVARDGQEALCMWQADPSRYAMLITDLHMPKLDGYELARRIRSEEAQQARSDGLPIVALTASASADERQRCHALGIDAVASKPLPIDELGLLLRQCRAARSATPRTATPR